MGIGSRFECLILRNINEWEIKVGQEGNVDLQGKNDNGKYFKIK